MPDRFMMPLAKLRPNPKQPRTEYDPDEMELLAADIEKNGQQVAIIAEAIPGTDEAGILDGHRRYFVGKDILELKELWVDLRINLTPKQRALILSSVTKQSGLTPLEHGLHVLEVLKETGWSQKRYCREASEDEPTVSRDLALARNLAPELIPDVRSGLLSARVAYLIATKLKGKPEEQVALAKRIKEEHLPLEQVSALLNGKKTIKKTLIKVAGGKVSVEGMTSKEAMIEALTEALAKLKRG